MVARALLSIDLSPAVAAAGTRAAVLPFDLSLRAVSPQSFIASARVHFPAAHHTGLRLDVPSRDAARRRQFALDSDRRRDRFRHGWRRLQTPSLPVLKTGPCYTNRIRISSHVLIKSLILNTLIPTNTVMS